MPLSKSNKINVVFIALFFLVSLNAQIDHYVSQIGNSGPLQQQTSDAMNQLRTLLSNADNFNPKYSSNLFTQVKNVSNLLYKLKQTIPSNNVVHGDKNQVSGNNIVVIGSKDTEQGQNDWIFASNYHSSTPENGILLIDNWKIDLTRINYLLAYPPLCITTITGNEFQNMFTSMMQNTKPSSKIIF